MPPTRFCRYDCICAIAGTLAAPRLQFTIGGARLDVDATQLTVQGTHVQLAPPILSELSRLLRDWRRERKILDGVTQERMVVQLASAELAALDWEGALAPDAQWPVVIRAVDVAPRALAVPFTLPLRVLQVDLSGSPSLDADRIIEDVFRVQPSGFADAVLVGRTPDAESFLRQLEWPTAEVLQLDVLLRQDPAQLLSDRHPSRPGTRAWLRRLSYGWQTRLCVLLADDDAQLSLGQRLAWTLASAGGPAVVLLRRDAANPVLSALYGQLIHDVPLDFIVAAERRARLVAGAGREEALRVSSVAERLAKIDVTQLPDMAKLALDDLRSDSNAYQFDLHERGGLLPLAKSLGGVRSGAGIAQPPRPRPAPPVGVPPHAPRFVDVAFAELVAAERPEAELQRLPRHEPLPTGKPLHLEVGIGPLVREGAASADLHPVLEEQFKWHPGQDGVWLDVAITAIDFELLGAPVQELWLPRSGASETISFAVRAPRSGWLRLRVCLYYENNVVQSRLVAALALDAGTTAREGAAVHKELAYTLGVDADTLPPGACIGHRLEFAGVVDGVEKLPPRRLSIVANDVDGDKRIAVKGGGHYDVRVDRNIPRYVEALRKSVRELSGAGAYEFKSPKPEKTHNALVQLAAAGWSLYAACTDGDTRAAIDADLQLGSHTIQVAQLLLDDVIPWALVYDRPFDLQRRQTSDQLPVAYGVCPASLRALDADEPCGAAADCALNAASLAARRRDQQPIPLPETTVCARHFWGLRHVIELPPLQARNDQARAAATTIGAHRPPSFVMAVSPELGLAADHIEDLKRLVSAKTIALLGLEPCHRDALLDLLRDGSLDVVYLYCHAAAEAAAEPALYVAAGETIEAANLAGIGRWKDHRPFIILNGCGTAGFSPEALSPFVITFLSDLHASGLLGTETPVWEELARAVAKGFLTRFLAGETAGTALLETRRELLAKGDPLGLVYTLYASADLRLGSG